LKIFDLIYLQQYSNYPEPKYQNLKEEYYELSWVRIDSAIKTIIKKFRIKNMNKLTNLNWMLLILFLVLLNSSFSQTTEPGFHRHEISLGTGYMHGFEKDIYNIPYDEPVGDALGITFGYCYYFNERIGLGIRVFGYQSGGSIFLPGVYYITSILDAINFDAELRYVFNRGKFEPYCLFVIGPTTGGTYYEDPHGSSSVHFSGINAGAGVGFKYRFGNHWKLSAELVGDIGKSSWEYLPYVNSYSRDFNSSMAGLLISISYLWGFKKGM
jgi:hypothetical protein